MYKLLVINKTDPNRFNCVLFARNKVRSLPYGLFTLEDKKKIINTQTSHVGDIAIMDVGGSVGHVGVVIDRGLKGEYKTILEANYRSGTITERTGSTKDLKIIGYYHPPIIKK